MLSELSYPFDAKAIIAGKKRLRRLLLEEKSNGRIHKKIAVLGGSTTSDIVRVLELFLLNYDIEPEFYESGYNQFYQEGMFPSDELRQFEPDFIYIHTTNRNILRLPEPTDSREKIESMLHDEMKRFSDMWSNLHQTFHCVIIQNNFDLPAYRLLGNRDVSDVHGTVNFIGKLNCAWSDYAQQHDSFYICDINYISADIGLKTWSNPQDWYLYKYAVSLAAIPALSFNVANIIKSLLGRNKKGLVLDLDNTLWGGVIGEDGTDGIALGPEEAEGEAYLAFQEYLKRLTSLGIILTIDSKNDFENAVAGLEHPNSRLKKEDFTVIKANWESKAQNLRDTALELNLLPESLVFVDDNPAERLNVAKQYPDVAVPVMESVADYIQIIDRSGFFEATNISADDLNRGQMYRENMERKHFETTYEDYSDYLRDLKMQARIKSFETPALQRITQLTNKSNQFNLTARRYTQEEIEAAAQNKNCITLYGTLRDRFGDNGIVSVVISHIIGNECHIDLWVMSCRVLKRDMELAMMDALIEECRLRGLKELHGYYHPTLKNKMVKDFYQTQGFRKASEAADGTTEWTLSLEDYILKNRLIQIIKEKG